MNLSLRDTKEKKMLSSLQTPAEVDHKKVIAKEIRNAHIAHEQWVRHVKHLVENLPVHKAMIPLSSTECDFGKWLYSTGMKYKAIPALTRIVFKIEQDHRDLHNIYLRIYKIYFLETQRSWAMNLFTNSRKKITPEKHAEAMKYYQEMEKMSIWLIKSLDQLESLLSKQKNETIASVI
jgi:hypothetical protein